MSTFSTARLLWFLYNYSKYLLVSSLFVTVNILFITILYCPLTVLTYNNYYCSVCQMVISCINDSSFINWNSMATKCVPFSPLYLFNCNWILLFILWVMAHYYSAQSVPNLATGSSLALAHTFFWHAPIVFWTFCHFHPVLSQSQSPIQFFQEALVPFTGAWHLNPRSGTRCIDWSYDVIASTPFHEQKKYMMYTCIHTHIYNLLFLYLHSFILISQTPIQGSLEIPLYLISSSFFLMLKKLTLNIHHIFSCLNYT